MTISVSFAFYNSAWLLSTFPCVLWLSFPVFNFWLRVITFFLFVFLYLFVGSSKARGTRQLVLTTFCCVIEKMRQQKSLQMRRLGSDVGGKKKESESVDMVNQRIEWQTGSGCGSIDKAVVSDTRGPRFESRHRRSVYWTLLAANCIEKAKIKKNRLETAHFF